MLGLLKKHPGAVLLAIGVHVVFFALLIVSFQFSEAPQPAADTHASVVQAAVVNEAQVQAELNKLKAEQRSKRAAQDKRRRDAEQAAQRAEQARKREERRLARLKQQQAAQQRQHLAQQKAEEARLAKLKREQLALQKQRAAEAKQVAALAAKRKAQEAAQRKAAEAAKRKAEEDAKRKAAEADLQKQLAAEEAQREAAARRKQQQRQATLTQQYIARIRGDISQNWLLPPNVRPGIACQIRVQLIPTGEVIAVQVVKSSGDPVFDRSVVNAVKRASPLPVPPPDSGIFDTFRSLTLSFKPEDKG